MKSPLLRTSQPNISPRLLKQKCSNLNILNYPILIIKIQLQKLSKSGAIIISFGFGVAEGF